MNQIFKAIATFFAVTMLSFSAKAQSGDYIINSQKDTVHCTISTSLFNMVGSYKLTDDGKSTKLKSAEIREYYIAAKKKLVMAMYREKKNKPEFFTVLEKGKIILLEGETQRMYGGGPNSAPYSSSSTQWYIAKGTDTVTEVKNSELSVFSLFNKSHKARKNDFVELISDNKDVFEKYKAEDKFSFKQVRKLVHLYNTGEPLKED